MAKQTLFVYARGTDLDAAASKIEERLDALVASRKWISKDVWVVNQKFDGPPVEWDLGLNLALGPQKTRPENWREDVVAIAKALGDVHRETGRAFVIGVHDDKTDTTKDLFVVDSDTVDVTALERTLQP